jgi:choline dehydrogenase-like flavoprotein
LIIGASNYAASAASRGRYDAVVIGGGTVGLIITESLVRRGLRVCVVEAGNAVARHPTGVLAAQSTGKKHAGVTLGRAVGLGGTSTLWGGQLAMFAPDDLARKGHEWPFGYAELRPWYDAACAVLGIPAPHPSSDYLYAYGVPAPPHGTLEPFFTAWLPQPNMAQLFRATIESDQVDLVLDATAHAFDFEGERAEGVRVKSRDGVDFTIAARHVILAAGTLGNVQIMLSAGKHGPVPWRDNALVGAYFHDHLSAIAGSIEVLDNAAFHRMFDNGVALGTKLQTKLRAKIRPADQPAVCGYFGFRSSHHDRIAEVKRLIRSFRSGLSFTDLAALPRATVTLGKVFLPIALRYARQRRILLLHDLGIDFLIQAEQWPIARSRIVATGEPDATGLVPVALDWQLDGREVPAIRDFVAQAGEFLESNGLAKVHPAAWLDDGPEGLRAVEDCYHQSGGLRMGTTAATGVTDGNATVFGTANVSVAGASILPSSSYANITFTAMALALRLADRVAHRVGLEA